MSSTNLLIAKKLMERNNEGDDNTILIVVLVFFAVVVVISLFLYFGNFLCSFYSFLGYSCPPASPAPSPTTDSATGSGGAPGASPAPGPAPSSGGAGDVDVPCIGSWAADAGGCSQPCYDRDLGIEGTQHKTFNVTQHERGGGLRCIDLARSLEPRASVIQNSSTGEITTANSPCNHDQPCMKNCNLSDTYAIISGYGVSSADPLCTTGLIPVEAAFTVNPAPPFYTASCSNMVQNAHAVSRTACPNITVTDGVCAPGYTWFPTTPVVAPPIGDKGDEDNASNIPTGYGPGCYGITTDTPGWMLHKSWHYTKDDSKVISLNCPSGYTVSSLTNHTCSPIDGWYRCAPNERRVPNISAQNGNPSSTALPGCAPCPDGQVSDGDKEPCHLPSQTCTPLSSPTVDFYTKTCA